MSNAEKTSTIEKTVVKKTTPTILFNDESLIATAMLQKGTTFAEITTVTDPRMLKTNNPMIGLVEKIGVANVMTGDDYEKGVQKKADKEGLDTVFEAQPLSWGSHYKESKFIIEHKGNFYFQCRVLASHSVQYRWIASKIALTDSEVKTLKTFLPKKSEGAFQPAKDKVIYRTFKVCNITEIKMYGVRFQRANHIK